MEWGSATVLLLLLIVPAIVTGFKKANQKKQSLSAESDKQSTWTVPTMTCKNCVTHVQKAIENVEGVEKVIIDLKTKKVAIRHMETISVSEISAAIVDAGYTVQE